MRKWVKNWFFTCLPWVPKSKTIHGQSPSFASFPFTIFFEGFFLTPQSEGRRSLFEIGGLVGAVNLSGQHRYILSVLLHIDNCKYREILWEAVPADNLWTNGRSFVHSTYGIHLPGAFKGVVHWSVKNSHFDISCYIFHLILEL